MEEQAEIYTYLPHDLMSDINIQSENTDVETPFEPKLNSSKKEKVTIKDTKDTPLNDLDFKLGTLSIASFDFNPTFFPTPTIPTPTPFRTTSTPTLSINSLCSINFCPK